MSESESGARPERKRKPVGFSMMLWLHFVVFPILGWVVYPIGAAVFGKPRLYIVIAVLIAVFAWGLLRPSQRERSHIRDALLNTSIRRGSVTFRQCSRRGRGPYVTPISIAARNGNAK